VYAHAGRSEQCGRLLRRLQAAEISLIAPSVVWAELCHIYMLEEVRRSSASDDALRLLGRNPDRVKRLRFYRERLKAWSDLGLGYEPAAREDLLDAGLKFQAKYGLLTHDSMVLAIAVRLDADCLITNDRGFFPAEEVEIVRPSDLRPGRA
jgi:predicted nucleic acid-binding protein